MATYLRVAHQFWQMRRKRGWWDRGEASTIVGVKITFISESADGAIALCGESHHSVLDLLAIEGAFEIRCNQFGLGQLLGLHIHFVPFLLLILVGQQYLVGHTVVLSHCRREPLLYSRKE